MSSIGDKDIDETSLTFDAKIDGLLDAFHWSGYAQRVMRFAMTTSRENYEDTRDGLIEDYPDDVHDDVIPMPQPMFDAILRSGQEFQKILTFNFENDQNAQNGARVRYGLTSFEEADDENKDAPAYCHVIYEETFFDDQSNWMSGDMFFDKDEFQNAKALVGSFEYHTILHETGHAMGLKHPHADERSDGEDATVLPREWDSMEFAVMSYRSFIGGPTEGDYSNRSGHFAQTLMMLDIAALQSMYGADFSTQKGNTVYSWDSGDGSYFIDGALQWKPAKNVVFMTIWDGNGNDTYDLSNYTTNLTVDLGFGGFVDFDTQLADLEVVDKKVTQEARANVFNALQYQSDTRSLIENAKAGSGDDRITGNIAWNRLEGGDGADTLVGGEGNDTLTGGAGVDQIDGGEGIDYAGYTEGGGVDVTIRRIGAAEKGRWSVLDKSGARTDDLDRIEGFVFGSGSDRIEVAAAPEIDIYAGGGDDTIEGGGGGGVLVGGKGADVVVFGSAGVFEAYGGELSADGVSIGQRSQNDLLRIRPDMSDDGYFLGVVDPTKLSQFFDLNGSTAEGFSRIDFSGTRGEDVLDGGVGNDTMAGERGKDNFSGHAGHDSLDGGDEDDQLAGGAGNDTLIGGGGADRIQGDEDADVIEGGAGADSLFGGSGDDRITTGGGADVIAEGGSGDDTITGAEAGEVLNGDADDDRISGGGGKDIVTGGEGADTLAGGADNDTLSGGGGQDRFVFQPGAGRDVINDFDADPKGGQDAIDLAAFDFDGFKDFQKSVSFSGGDNVTITFDRSFTLRLFDVSKADLDAADFLF